MLFLTSRLPFPPVGGDRVRTFQFVKHMSRRHRVTILSFVQNEEEARAAEPYRELYDRIITVPLSRTQSYLSTLRGLASTEPLQVHYYESPRMHAALAAELASRPYDVVFCHMIRMVKYLDDVRIRKVVDFCDAVSLYHQRGAELSRGVGMSSLIHTVEARRAGPYEIAAINRVDASIFISHVDADYCRRASNSDKIFIVRNGVDASAFPFHPEPRDENRIVYMGNMRTFQNSDAVVYFVKDIFPLILKERPEAVLHIVGNEPSKRVLPLHDGKHVIVTGRVESVIPYIANASVVVAPMRAVAGVQNKILESLAIGTPVVTTSIGAEGLEPGIMAIADTPAEFARATLDLMRDPAQRLERAMAARKYIETNYSWEKALAELDAILAGAAAGTALQSSPA